MAKSLISIVNDLYSVESLVKKEELSKNASSLLRDGEQVNIFLFPIINRLSLKLSELDFESIVNGDFYELNVNVYKDVDNFNKISIRMSFLQDFENSIEDFDEIVALKILEDVLRYNLDLVVNDICVNMVQYRNGIREQ